MRSLICQELASSAWDEKDMKRSALFLFAVYANQVRPG
jgi:hypothetical protein